MSEANGPVRALILFGAPGSGKGTQAKLVNACLGLPHISTGDMLRERMQRGDELGLVIRRLLDSGDLVTDDLVNQMVEERISQPDCARGFILDGYPRTVGQAGSVCRELATRGIGWLVIHLKVDYNEIIGRIAGRRHCCVCGAVFNLVSNPPVQVDSCDRCGSRLVTRDDDRESVVKRRLEAYEAQTRPLLEFFAADQTMFVEVEGGGVAPPLLAQRICSLVSVPESANRAQ
jgi:adenylate kinase